MISSVTSIAPLEKKDGLTDFASDVFSSLGRVDQRRWAAVYLRGLLVCEGRKTIRNIANTVLQDPTEGPLRQFVNRSPWEWGPVRERLSRYATEHLPGGILVVGQTIIPKNGRHSVGVARRFVPALGRTVNCQVALCLQWASPSGATTLDWRILLPGGWDHDRTLRERARIPGRERNQPIWRHALDMIDGYLAQVGETVRCVVVDGPCMPDVARFAEGLAARGLPFLLQAPDTLGSVVGARPLRWTGGVHGERATLADRLTHERVRPLPGHTLGAAEPPYASRPPGVPWPRLGWSEEARGTDRAAAGRTGMQWLTTVDSSSDLGALGRILEATERSRETRHALETAFGLCDFEGRSFPGWHRHATMVAAAHAFDTVERLLLRQPPVGKVCP